VYEKLQIFELAKQTGSDWNIYIDSDALIHPECPDFTIYLPMGSIAFHHPDLSYTRFKNSDYNLRYGRYHAAGNWFMIGSRLCLDLWRPLEMSAAEAVSQCTPTPAEIAFGMTAEHLVDDYALSQNMARFGLDVKFIRDLYDQYKLPLVATERDGKTGTTDYFRHLYLLTIDEKVKFLSDCIKEWKLEGYL
jgi:hypothetical protein